MASIAVLGLIEVVGGSLMIAFAGPLNAYFTKHRQRTFTGEFGRMQTPDFIYRIVGGAMVAMGLFGLIVGVLIPMLRSGS